MILDAELEDLIGRALAEDVGEGDATTAATVDAAARARATITQKAPGVISGLAVAEAVFARLDPEARIERLGPEGQWREAGAGVLAVEGSARALLTGERTALNFLGRLSGIATLTAQVVARVREAGGTVKVLDTRKTTPGLRAAREGGGRGGRRRQPPRRALRRDADQGEPLGARGRGGGGGAARARGAAGSAAVRRGARPRGDRGGACSRRSAAAAGQHDPAGGGRRGRPGGGKGGDRGVGRRDPGVNIGLCDHRWARLHLDGRAHPLRARPRPLSRAGGTVP